MKDHVLFLYDLFNFEKTEETKLAYHRWRNKYKNAVEQARKSHNTKFIKGSGNKCKSAWKVINSLAKTSKKESVPIPPDVLNNYFIGSVNEISKSIVKPNINPITMLNQSVHQPLLRTDDFEFSEVSPEFVLNIVKHFRSSDRVDMYDISSNLIKKVIDVIAHPLTFCINL